MANKTNTKTTYNAAEEAAAKVDEQGILDKFNAATTAQYNVQRDQNRLAENQFYNKMYNTQKTAMDTIRQNNAAAVATGASRGVQAANELSALLGLQQESVAGATEVAQAQRQTAQEETAAVLENVLKAYQQAEAERQNRRTAAIEGGSVDTTQADSTISRAQLITSAAENGAATYLTGLQSAGIDFSDGNVTTESLTSINTALNGATVGPNGKSFKYTMEDWDDDNTGASKGTATINNLKTIINAYGLDLTAYQEILDDYTKVAEEGDVDGGGAVDTSDDIFNKYGVMPDGKRINDRTEYAAAMNAFTTHIVSKIYADYLNGLNRKTNLQTK